MKVLHCIHSLEGGGAETQAKLLCHGLKGHDIESNYACVDPIETYLIDKPIHIIKRSSKYDIKIFKELSRIFDVVDPDVIHAWLPAAITIPVMLLARWKRIPIIFSYRNKMFFHRPISYPEYIVALLCADKVVSNNLINQSIAPFRWLYKIKHGETIYNAVSSPRVIKSLLEEKKESYRFVFVGRLTAQKNVLFMIKALSGLKNSDNWCLDIFGDGELRSEVEHLVQDLGLAERIKIKGFTSSPAEEMVNADLLLFPSLYEGMPNVLVEAFSVGIPVIASDISASRDVVKNIDCVEWFSPAEEKEFQDKIKLFLNEPQSFNKKVLNALDHSKKFSIAAMSEKYSKAYRSLL
jgi:glycosyltransferase involved in cell wall biosynthesis